MSAVDHKGDCASGGKDENMEAIENRESQTDDHHLKKISEIGSGDSKKSEKEGNLMSIELEEEEVVKITEINPLELNTVKSSITSLTDDNLATILSMTTPSTSKVIEKSIVLDTNDIDTKSHSDTTPIIEISKSDESLIGKMLQNQSNDEKDQVTASKDNKTEATDKHNDSFDIELKWDDDESEHELSEEALKLLDQELGIDDIISTNEIESKTLQNTNTAINNSKSDVDDVNVIDKNDQLEAKTDVKDNEKTSNEEISSQSNTIEENAIKSQDSELNKDCINLDVDEPTAVTSNPSGEKNISTEKMDVDIIDNLNIDKTNEGRKEIADTDIEMHDSTNTGITDEVKNENYKLTSLIVEEVNIDSNKDTESIILIEKTNEDDRSETSDNIKNDKVEMPCIGHNTITVESIEVIETDDDNKQETTVIKKETADDDLKNEELINTNDDLSEQKTMDNNTGTPKQGQALGMKTNLGLNKPDIMLEIPTQELIDIDEFDESFDVKKEADALENVTANEVEIKDQVDTATKITSDDKPELTVTDIVKEKEDSKALNDKEDLNIKTADITEKSADTNVKSADININSIDTNVNPNEKPLLGDAKPSTSKSVIDVVDIPISDTKSVDNNVKSANTDLTANEQASNCKIEDSTVEEPEVAESLLAESSRTVDDDDDHDEDDSDDFDPDDESSNHMTAEHSEESNPPPSESDLVKEEECEKEIALPGDSMVETEAQCDDNDEPGLDIVDDIDCEETVLAEGGVDTMNEDSLDIKLPIQKYEMSEPESQQKDKEVASEKEKESMLRNLLSKEGKDPPIGKQSPSKRRLIQLNNSTAKILSFVDLEESSDEDTKGTNKVKNEPKKENEDSSIDITKDEASTEENSVIKSKAAFKMTKLNTGEVSIKTGVSTKPPLIIPEITNTNQVVNKQKNTLTEEVFTLDSDSEEEKEPPPKEEEEQATNIEAQTKFNTKCINPMCTTSFSEQHYVADANAVRYYGPTKKRAVCGPCLKEVQKRNQSLIDGIKNLTPLLELNMDKPTNQLVEISDSESEDESEILKECKEIIGGSEANMLSEKLVDLINEAWQKFNMDDRLKASEDFINKELQKLEDEGTEVNKLLNECQKETDKIRTDLYNTFYKPSTQLPAIAMYDTPVRNYTCLERDAPMPKILPARQSKSDEPPAKKVNRGTNEASAAEKKEDAKIDKQDDDRDVSVVLLSAEAAPAWLPPAGELARPALEPGLPVHAMRNAFGSWLRARIQDVLPKTPQQQYTNCRVKFEHNMKNQCKVLPARCLAYQEPCNVRMTIGTRVLALFRDVRRKESFYSGVVAEIPNPVNSYRYLVFFDDGYAQYVKHQDTRLVCESKSSVWEEVHPFIRDFVREYLLKYPERPMVRMRTGEQLNTEWNGKWWRSKVLQVDASLALVHFIDDDRTEWIYRGSTRLAPLYLELQAAERHRTRLPRSKGQFSRTNMPYVEYMRSEEQPKTQQQEEILRRQRAVAKKSTTQAQAAPPDDKSESAYSRVVHYTPKNAVKPHKMVPHTCGPHCKRNDVLSLKDLKTYNPLTKPLLSGWERILVRYKGIRAIMYRAPCGRRLRHMIELHRYLQLTDSELPVDLFDFSTNTQCLAEYVIHNNIVMKKDLSHGKENVPIPCVNHLDDSLPEFCSYNTERTPTSGVPLNLDPEFLCGCDCEDDCEDKSKCACWQMTLEGARTIGLDDDVGYLYRRLPEPLPSGIYECNSRCKCKSTCLNRVAQHPLQLKLQVFKTNKRGWGIRALNDVPRGAFLCVYAGNLLTDATANLDGLNEGDEYLAELDYIEVVEQMKEGFEEDIPEADKKLDKKESKVKSASENEEETESEEEQNDSDKMDDDFQPGHIGMGLIDFDKRLRKRNKKKQEEDNKEKEKEGDGEKTDNCITISDDEEVREPSRFTAQAGMGDKEFVSKYRSVRTLFGEDEACYIMDAKVQGNIGRYLNHSCQPNVFVQNVFVDTHDPRFPWVAFFALTYIKAGTELTWNYNYDIGSVPGKVLYCFCGADNCRGRLL